MKKDEVPQDASPTYGGQTKLVYAVDANGDYVGVSSSGWEVEAYATLQAVESFDAQRDEAERRARAGETSALDFHMWDRRMDMATLAAATGYAEWRIRRHLKPAVFAALPDRKLEPYARALGLEVAYLRELPAK